MKTKSSRSVLTKVGLFTMFAMCVISAPSFHEFNAFAFTEKPIEIQDGSVMFLKSRFEDFNNFKGDVTRRMFDNGKFIPESDLKLSPSIGKIVKPIISKSNKANKGNRQNTADNCKKILLNRCYKDIHN